MKRFVFWILTLLFVITPLIFSTNSSELFEFPKILVIYLGAGLIFPLVIIRIYTLYKEEKAVFESNFKKYFWLWINLCLFLLSQLLSSIFSIDPWTSVFGYYSRFNGGLLSTIAYLTIFAGIYFYLEVKDVWRLLGIIFFTGVIVVLWTLPSYFGADFICLAAGRGLSINCWTEAFNPKERLFGTLGQPNWLAAYLLIILFIDLLFFTTRFKLLSKISDQIHHYFYIIVFIILSIELWLTKSRSGLIPYIIFVPLFFGLNYLHKQKGVLWQKFNRYSQLFFWCAIFATLISLWFYGNYLNKARFSVTAGKVTASSTIRQIVWQGAIHLGNRYPIFGTGVETFGFSYGFTRPKVHNLTSEWDYIYNKAHNELLNYLATSGYFGLICYLLLFISFLYIPIIKKIKVQNEKNTFDSQKSIGVNELEIFYFSALVSIFITNFFGFSTTNISLFTFTLPALFLVSQNNSLGEKSTNYKPSKTVFAAYFLYLSFLVTYLFNYFSADYYYNQAKAARDENDLVSAYQLTDHALSLRTEPTYLDLQSLIAVNIAASLKLQKQETQAQKFTNQALQINNQLLAIESNKESQLFTFWKTRFKIYYLLHLVYLGHDETDSPNTSLSQKYFFEAISALKQMQHLSPTNIEGYFNEANLWQKTDPEKTKKLLQKTLNLKADYQPAKELLQKLEKGIK